MGQGRPRSPRAGPSRRRCGVSKAAVLAGRLKRAHESMHLNKVDVVLLSLEPTSPG